MSDSNWKLDESITLTTTLLGRKVRVQIGDVWVEGKVVGVAFVASGKGYSLVELDRGDVGVMTLPLDYTFLVPL